MRLSTLRALSSIYTGTSIMQVTQEMSLDRETKNTFVYSNPRSSWCTGVYILKALFPQGAPATIYNTISDTKPIETPSAES
jgi:hypothetical protein